MGYMPRLLKDMSEEQLKGFREAIKADAGLQEKLKAAGDADAVVAIAKSVGFAISAEDLAKAQAGLSDEELGGVAGGVCSYRWCTETEQTITATEMHFAIQDARK
jgi:predicted ribosomally synthesized peptide with nif11-like leader